MLSYLTFIAASCGHGRDLPLRLTGNQDFGRLSPCPIVIRCSKPGLTAKLTYSTIIPMNILKTKES